MKKLSLLFCVALAVWFASCKSTEQVAEEPAKTETVQEVKEETPAQEEAPVDNGDSMSAVEAARKAALDAGAKDAYADAFAVNDAAFEALKALNDGGPQQGIGRDKGPLRRLGLRGQGQEA